MKIFESKKRASLDHKMLPRSADGLVSPMQFNKPLPEDPPLYFPTPSFSMDGEPGLITEEDFASGRMTYLPGHELPFTSPDIEAEPSRVVYDDPVANLSFRDRQIFHIAKERLDENDEHTSKQNRSSVPNAVLGAWGRLCNFMVRVLALRTTITRGEPSATEIQLELTSGFTKDTFALPQSKLRDLPSYVTENYPACYIEIDTAKAAARIENLVRQQIPSAPHRVVYRSPGFEKIGKRWVFVHDGAAYADSSASFETGFSIPRHPFCIPTDALQNALSFLTISPRQELVLPLFLFAHLGPLYELFRAAGHTPRFVVFLNGTTGSLKTSLSLALFRLFNELPNSPEISLTAATKAGIEVRLHEAASRVILVDDFAPAVTGSKTSLELLEHVIRTYGDDTAKARSNSSLKNVKRLLPTGCCIVTGEDVGGSQSSLLRCVVLPIARGDVDGTKLRPFQDDPTLLGTHFHHFLQWAGTNGDTIIEFVRTNFQAERSFFTDIVPERRQADAGALLSLVAQILLWYMKDLSAPMDLEGIAASWRSSLVQALQSSTTINQTADPVALYLNALFSLEASQKVSIGNTVYGYDPARDVGFRQNGQLFLRPDDAYALARQYCSKMGQPLYLSPSKMHERIFAAGLLDPVIEIRNGKERIQYIKKGPSPYRSRFLVLHEDAAREYLENNENGGFSHD